MRYQTRAQRRYPRLSVLVAGYLHKDYPARYGSLAEATRDFMRHQPDAEIVATAAELRQLRGEQGDAEAVRFFSTGFKWPFRVSDGAAATAMLDEIGGALTGPRPADAPTGDADLPGVPIDLETLVRSEGYVFDAARKQRSVVRTKASSFYDQKTAERAVTEIFRARHDELQQWVRSPRQVRIAADRYFAEPQGTVVLAGERIQAGHVAVVVAVHDNNEGVRIENTYLNPGEPGPDGLLPSAHHDALFQLFAGQLGEDFLDDYDSVEEAVADFADAYPREIVAAAATDLAALRGEHGDTEALMGLLLLLGNGVPAGPAYDRTVTGYLDEVAALLDRHLASPRSG